MGYKKAVDCLPQEVIELIQQYVDGENIYIPKKENERQQWGAKTRTRQELRKRNRQIFQDYLSGKTLEELEVTYFLSGKSIQRIIREEKITKEKITEEKVIEEKAAEQKVIEEISNRIKNNL